MLTTWVGVHYGHINADRLVRCVSEHPSDRVHAYWAAVARWLSKDRRFARLAKRWRADVWTVLEKEPDVSVAEAARRAGCSFATAWQVVQDFWLLHAPRDSDSAAGQI